MSPQEKTLVDRGAESVGGDLMLNRKVVGHCRAGSFVLTPEGIDELAIEDVAFVEVAAPGAPVELPPVAAKKPGKKAKAVEAPVEPEPEVAPVEPALSDELDSLLAPVPDA